MSISRASTVESPFVLPCYVCLVLCKKSRKSDESAVATCQSCTRCYQGVSKKKNCSVSIVFNKHVLLFTLKVNQGDASEAADGEQETGEE